jgi:hypothetical protein
MGKAGIMEYWNDGMFGEKQTLITGTLLTQTRTNTYTTRTLRPFEDVVRTDSSENVNSSLDLEGETIVFGDPSFPDVWKAFHLLRFLEKPRNL